MSNLLKQAEDRMKEDFTTPFSIEKFKNNQMGIYVTSDTTLKELQLTSFDSPLIEFCFKEPQGRLVLPPTVMLNKSINYFIQESLKYEQVINPFYEDCYFYLSVWKQYVRFNSIPHCTVLDGDTNKFHLHADGLISSSNEANSKPVSHHYVVSDRYPIKVYNDSLDTTGFDVSKTHFSDFAFQYYENNKIKPSYIEPFRILLYSGYQVHEMPTVQLSDYRITYRLDVSHYKYNNKRVSKNPHLSAKWDFIEHNLPPRVNIRPRIRDESYLPKATLTNVSFCKDCGRFFLSNYNNLCLICDDLRLNLSRQGRLAIKDTIEYHNMDCLNWIYMHNPMLDLEDFTFVKAICSSSNTKTDHIKVIFYSPTRRESVYSSVPITMIENMMTKQVSYNKLVFTTVPFAE